MIVDWLKHAFITKFNHVRASIYERFTDVLAKDVLLAGTLGGGRGRLNGRSVCPLTKVGCLADQRELQHPVFLDQSPLVARRLGFASIPLACLVIRIGAQAVGMLTTTAHHADDMPGFGRGGWAWIGIKWTAGIGVGLCAWGW